MCLAVAGSIIVGTCGFQKSRRLHLRNLDVVEVQQTFYDPPGEDTLKKWISEAPEGFEFTVKVWMLITHEYNKNLWRRIKREVPGDPSAYGSFKLNKWTLWALEETLRAARALNARILVFQTPASFSASEENAGNIVRFFKEVDLSDYILVWEPRGTWWEKTELLDKVRLEAGLIISGDILRGKPVPRGQDILYTRLHGLGGRGEVNYRYKYTDEDLAKLKALVDDYIRDGSKSAYVLFNNVYAYDDAIRFKELIKSNAPRKAT